MSATKQTRERGVRSPSYRSRSHPSSCSARAALTTDPGGRLFVQPAAYTLDGVQIDEDAASTNGEVGLIVLVQ